MTDKYKLHDTCPTDVLDRVLLYETEIPDHVFEEPRAGDKEDEPYGKLYRLIPKHIIDKYKTLSISDVIVGPKTYRKLSELSLQWAKYQIAERFYTYLSEEELIDIDAREEKGEDVEIRPPTQKELDSAFKPEIAKRDYNAWAMYSNIDRGPNMANEVREGVMFIMVRNKDIE